MRTVPEINNYMKRAATAAKIQYQCGPGGTFDASIAIVGQSVGNREVMTQMPLSGESGELFWTAIKKHGINRNNTYQTNLIKRIVPRGSGGGDAIAESEISYWETVLMNELLQLPNLKYVLILGEMAMKAIMGVKGISNWRGSVVKLDHPEFLARGKHIMCMPIFNPAGIVERPNAEIIFNFDLNTFNRLVTGKWTPTIITPILFPSPEDVLEWCDKLQDEKTPICVDIETHPKRGITTVIGLTNIPNKGMAIPLVDGSYNDYYTANDEMLIRNRLCDLFADTDLRFVAHNGSYDMSWLWFVDKLRVHKIWFDTMLAHHLLYPPLPHGLDFLTSQMTTHPYYKDESELWSGKGDFAAYCEYNVKDICITLLCQRYMKVQLEKRGLDHFFNNHVMRLSPHLVRATIHGITFDSSSREDVRNAMQKDLDLSDANLRVLLKDMKLDSAYVDGVNFNSPQQVSTLFFDRMKLVGRGRSTDEENRDVMRHHRNTTPTGRAVLDEFDNYKALKKMVSSYANVLIDPDGRYRSKYKQTGVARAPGRLSASKTDWRTGNNIQNWPPSVRKLLIADPGYVFLYFDMRQIEAQYVARLADIKLWIEQFEKARIDGSYDAHRALASMLFDVPYDNVPKEDFIEGKYTIRYLAKRARHGLNYRMAAELLAVKAGIPLDRARELYALYHRMTPELQVWWQATLNEARTNRRLISPLGREWLLLDRINESSFDSIIAFKPQSTAGDHVASVMYNAQEDPDWQGDDAIILLNNHDSLTTMVRDDKELVMHTARILRKYAEAPVHMNGYDVIVPADFAISVPDESGLHRWSNLSKIKGAL